MRQRKFSGERMYLQTVTPETALLPDETAKGENAHAILEEWATKQKQA
jgi:hypothetical protein